MDCSMHGKLLRHAITQEKRYITLAEALKDRDKDYFCPGCGIGVYPEGGSKIISADYYRRGHFNVKPKQTTRQSVCHASQLELCIGIMEANLAYSRDFDEILSDLHYVSEIKKGQTWTEYRTYPVQIYARRDGDDPISAIIHMVDLPIKSANHLYQPLKEIAQDQYSTTMKKRSIYDNQRQISLPKAVHQNIVLMKTENSFKMKGRRLELTPTIFNFIGFFTGTINYFNPDTLTLEKYHLKESSPAKPMQNPNRYFSFGISELPYLSIGSKAPVKKKKSLTNWKERNSVYIPHWRHAEFISLQVDRDGQPESVRRKNGQMQILF